MVRVGVRVRVRVRVRVTNPNPALTQTLTLALILTLTLTLTLTLDLVELVRGLAELFRERGLLEKSAADTHGLFEWRTRADVFQSFPRRKFRQSAADPPWSEADCRGTNLVRRVRGGFRVGNFYSAKNKNCRIPRRRRSDPLGPTRTQADSIGVRRGIVPPTILPIFFIKILFVSRSILHYWLL